MTCVNKREIILLLFTVLIYTVALGQSPSKNYQSKTNQVASSVYIRCYKCNGKKNLLRQQYRACSNCDYWTKQQRDYNYCNVCRNQRRILYREVIEKCTQCNGKGKIGGLVNKPLIEILNGYLTDMQSLGYYNDYYQLGSKVYFADITDKNTLHFAEMPGSLSNRYDLYIREDGTATMNIRTRDKYKVGVYHGKWKIKDDVFNLNIDIITYYDEKTEFNIIKSKNK